MADDISPPSYEEATGAIAVTHSVPHRNECLIYDSGLLSPSSASTVQAHFSETTPILYVDKLSEHDLRTACYRYVVENCCYGSRFVREMHVTGIENGYAFHYQLESFGEKRESLQRNEAYYGQSIDGPENGRSLDAWDVIAVPPANFKDYKMQKEMPHTAYVRECGKCTGNRQVRCDFCRGEGGETCWNCVGTGTNSVNRICSRCNGEGRKVCFYCDGRGQVKCSACSGHGRLKHYELLIITWKNHTDDFISNTLNLPKELIRKVSGREIFKEEGTEVSPISQVPDRKVNEASRNLLRKHATSFPNELIRKQKHSLRAIPLTRALYKWNNKEGEFYVYGFQKKVYFEDYPQQCCCCIFL